MRPSRPSENETITTDEDGSAALEFVVVGLLLLVPVCFELVGDLVRDVRTGAQGRRFVLSAVGRCLSLLLIRRIEKPGGNLRICDPAWCIEHRVTELVAEGTQHEFLRHALADRRYQQ